MNADAGKQAVILSGGAANGAYEVGVLKALMTGASHTTNGQPLDPAVLSGTSIGAYTASLLVSYLESAEPEAAAAYLEHVWLEVIPRDDTMGHNQMYRFRGNPSEYLNLVHVARNPIVATLQFASDLQYLARDSLSRSMRFVQSAGALFQRAIESVDLSTFITREPFERLLTRTVNFETIARSHRVLIVAASPQTSEPVHRYC